MLQLMIRTVALALAMVIAAAGLASAETISTTEEVAAELANPLAPVATVFV